MTSLPAPAYKFVFEEEGSWQELLWESMTDEDKTAANLAWQKAEFPPVSDSSDQ